LWSGFRARRTLDRVPAAPTPSFYGAARRGPTNHGSVGRPRSGRDLGGNKALAVGLGLRSIQHDEDGDGDRPARVRSTAALLAVSAEAVLAHVRLGIGEGCRVRQKMPRPGPRCSHRASDEGPTIAAARGLWPAITAAPVLWVATRVS
jgi:hypothetical protein